MASLNKSASNSRQQVQRSDSDSARWIAGLLLAFVGFFAAASVFFSYFDWAADQSGLQLSAEERETLGVTPENLCGWAGARLGLLLVDRSFGLCGILLPVIVMLIGVRVIRKRPLLINHFALSLLLVMLLGSLTLGFAFGTRWSLCASTGWGGAFGIGIAELLHRSIGAFGTIILLVGGWILTGVFINRNFINTVNEAGQVVVDKSGQIVDLMRHRVTASVSGSAAEEAPADAADPASAAIAADPVRPQPAPAAAPASAAPAASGPAAAGSAPARPAGGGPPAGGSYSRPAARPAPEQPLPAQPAPAAQRVPVTVERPAGESPFELISPAEEEPFPAPAAPETTPEPTPAIPVPTEENPFVEVDLSKGRVVMGSNGLVELEQPAPPTPPAPPVQNGPFTEIDLSKLLEEEPAPAASAADRPAAQPAEGIVAVPIPAPAAPAAGVAGGLVEGGAGGAVEGVAGEPAGNSFEPPFAGAQPGGVPQPGTVPAPEAGRPGTAFQPGIAPQPDAVLQPGYAPQSVAASQTGFSPQPLPAAAPTEGLVVTVEKPEVELVDEKRFPTEPYDPTKDLLTYRMPPVTLLEDYRSSSEVSSEEIFDNKARIEETLANFGIPIQKIKATVGPTVTLYEIVQAQGVKISKIQGLEQDIAQSLKALGIRIIAPIPGKGTIGIEVPNRDKKIVSMFSAIRSRSFFESKAELPVVIGRTIQNENYVFDLAKMPHLLVAGATGMGKSVGLNAIITSLLYRKHPSQLKLVMIDPKMVEFSLYAKLEHHFLAKMESEEKAIITDPMKAVYTLNSLCTEMDNRLEMLSEAGVRNIVEYNEKFTSRRLNPEKGHRYLPYIVVVVDEFADLIMMAREVERPVMRLAQKARAVGIHLIIATQRPDVKVITGGIKANFPARIAFRVMQMIDSRTILDRPGANQLIGRGDMLFSKDGDVTRIQCALVETNEVERIVDFISRQQGYLSAYALPDYQPEGNGDGAMGSEEADTAPKRYDSLFAEIARDAVQSGSISTSMIQRNYEVGFNRAGRIMMQLERAGIVGRQQGAKPRDILFHDSPSLEAKLQELGLF